MVMLLGSGFTKFLISVTQNPKMVFAEHCLANKSVKTL